MQGDYMTGQKAMSKAKEAVPYDFQRPTTLAREHSRILDTAGETLARQLTSSLGTRLRAKVTVSPSPASLTTYSSYTDSLPSTTAIWLLAMDASDIRGLFQMPVEVAADWVSRMMGSDGEVFTADHRLSPTEVGIMRKTVAQVMEDLNYSFGNLMDAPPVPESSVHYSPGFAQAAGPSDLMVLNYYTITVGTDTPVLVSMALPSELIMPRLGSSNPVDSEQDAARLMLEQVSTAPVTVNLEATHTELNSLDILKLNVGDVIPLNHPIDKPYSVTVDGVPLGTATETVYGSRKYMKIKETESSK